MAGTISSCHFNVLVFREHAQQPDFELAGSRISKLWIYCEGKGVVYNWDRGIDIEAKSEEVEDLVELICSELADQVCFDVGDRIRLLAMDDPDPVPIDSLGTISAIHDHRDWLQIEVDRDNGRRLMLSVPPDRVEVI